jgi:membrane protease YdiL (CAAX protease family)
MNPLQRFPLSTYFLLAYAWTWLCWWSAFAVSTERISLPISRDSLATLGQFGPFAAALVVTAAAGGGRRPLRSYFTRFTRWRARPVWLLVSLFLLPALMMTAILLYAVSQGTVSSLEFRDTWTTLPALFVYSLIFAGSLGEEPGWRGFALPRLQARDGPVAASVVLGLLWAGWHLPLWWLNPAPMPYPIYVVALTLSTFLFTWLFNHTHGSVFYALLLHASVSTASVRLPDAPAHYTWVACLACAVLIILTFDRRLGLTDDTSDTIVMPITSASPTSDVRA